MSGAPDDPSDLSRILSEFLVRRQRGEPPALDEYCQRFPDLAKQLRLHVQLYDALADVVPATDDTAIGPREDPSTVSRGAPAPSSGNERLEASTLRSPEAGAWDSDYESFKLLLRDMAGEQSAATLLPLIVRRLAGRPNVALARIWLVGPGDQCATCPARPECPDQTSCLHLVASAGRPLVEVGDWSRLDGRNRPSLSACARLA
jgi:hypothetical protein